MPKLTVLPQGTARHEALRDFRRGAEQTVTLIPASTGTRLRLQGEVVGVGQDNDGQQWLVMKIDGSNRHVSAAAIQRDAEWRQTANLPGLDPDSGPATPKQLAYLLDIIREALEPAHQMPRTRPQHQRVGIPRPHPAHLGNRPQGRLHRQPGCRCRGSDSRRDARPTDEGRRVLADRPVQDRAGVVNASDSRAPARRVTQRDRAIRTCPVPDHRP